MINNVIPLVYYFFAPLRSIFYLIMMLCFVAFVPCFVRSLVR